LQFEDPEDVGKMTQVRGVLTKIFEPVQVTKDFRRRNVIVTTSDDMGRKEVLSLEFFQDHCKIPDDFKEGDKVVLKVKLKGRKWTDSENIDKYFNTLQAWKMAPDTSTDDIDF